MPQLFACKVSMGITGGKKMDVSAFVILIMVSLTALPGDERSNHATLALLQKCPMNFVLEKW